MSTTVSSQTDTAGVARTRMLCVALAAIVVFDTIWVLAPFLVILAVPYAVAAWRYRRGGVFGTIVLTLFALLFVALGVTYILNNGLHDPQEVGKASEIINPGDFLFAYVGTPIAAWLCVRSIMRLARRLRHDSLTTEAAVA